MTRKLVEFETLHGSVVTIWSDEIHLVCSPTQSGDYRYEVHHSPQDYWYLSRDEFEQLRRMMTEEFE